MQSVCTAQPAACPIALGRAVDPDLELVEKARSGDIAAFGALVERHGAVVHRIAARVVGSDVADDVSQDVFLRAFHRLGRFRGEGAFRSWLLQIAHNTALDTLARRVPEPAGAPAELDAPEGEASPERQPAGALEESERRDRLELKLGELRPEHRTVLVLRDLEGLAYEEIAQVTSSPVGTVKGRLHRARSEMVEIMRSNTYDWDLPE
jgi:RNA polymerase sigma-70 factor (ECF subfamily)